MQARTDIQRVIEFLYTNIDFFCAPYGDSAGQFRLWAESNSEKMRVFSEDMEKAYYQGTRDTYWMLVSQQKMALLALRKGNMDHISKFLFRNPKIIQAITLHFGDEIINKWYETNAIKSDLDRKKRRAYIQVRIQRQIQEEIKINRYYTASLFYKKHLEDEIEQEINKINDKTVLINLYRALNQTNNKDACAAVPKDDGGPSVSKAKIVDGLLQQYKNPEIKKTIDAQLVDEPKLVSALDKYTVINAGEDILTNGKISTKKAINSYHTHLINNKDILMKRRDNAFETFMKGLGVVAAGLFGIVGSFVAYHYLFGAKATDGGKLISTISDINDEIPSITCSA